MSARPKLSRPRYGEDGPTGWRVMDFNPQPLLNRPGQRVSADVVASEHGSDATTVFTQKGIACPSAHNVAAVTDPKAAQSRHTERYSAGHRR